MAIRSALHPNSVQVFVQGCGKEAVSMVAAAIGIAAERGTDVVLVDTAGRMQDHEPFMRELSKIIGISEPDLLPFVGEALVGNEAAVLLVKFNQALYNLLFYLLYKPPFHLGNIFFHFDYDSYV
ncbi:hypothetical protein KIN20_015465 [Parelaphostrongylus tenuis]|uniref:SRP54-type proteins GTP-binding domain-containing protein n=1 Tax=Parelaphostrongylus tenuis TaxID=148309 RepID=A0AAD5N0C2_PARTN|nr:hypothetical protein KIN20_015465 [Parelaphostrongylus tenuis]